MVTSGRLQALGGLLLLAGLLLWTRSPWPLVAAGVLLLAGPEVPGLIVLRRRWAEKREIRRRFLAETGKGQSTTILGAAAERIEAA